MFLILCALCTSLLVFAIITMDCLTYGGLFKGAWWQCLRRIWWRKS